MRHIGVSNFDVEQLQRIQSIAPVETLQPPYSLVAHDGEHGRDLPLDARSTASSSASRPTIEPDTVA